jgi:asparagine synthase (glutamine-hydrolysing)
MCGITGIISSDCLKISRERLQRMTDAIAHRGPDGEGFWINQEGNAGFGHRRLSIIDLSMAAAQPMHYLDHYTIVYNGEIYNYPELKETLGKKGYLFHTQSDTEVILAAYDCFREECLGYFDGMFAFAIWDESKKSLFAARDRFGEKPFYYSLDEDQLSFASEKKALWAGGLPKEINQPLLLNWLVLGHSQTAADTTITFHKDIYSLPPAHYLLFHLPSFHFQLKSYWDCDKEKQNPLPEPDAMEKLKELLFISVKRRLRSDVPLGTSLSGGLDSSSIAAVLSGEGAGTPTFSAIFPGFEKDESAYIRLVTQKFNLTNFSVTPSADDLIKDFEKLCYHQEEPFSSASIYAQFKIFELARKQGVKVLLDGQGADEIFAGYTKYIPWYLQELLKKQPWKLPSEKRALKRNNLSFNWGWKNYLAAWFPAQTAYQLEKRESRKILKDPYIKDDYKQLYFDRQSIFKPLVFKLNDLLYFNACGPGLEELLRFADRNSMSQGCEVRLPFLYHELVQFIFSLPSTFKIRKGWTKWLLRKTMSDRLPSEIAWRRDKIGFEPPQKNWMENQGFKDLLQEARTTLVEKGILHSRVLAKKIQPQDAHAADNYDWRHLVAGNFLKGK